MQQDEKEAVLLSLSEAGRELGLSIGHLRNLCDEGRLPCFRDSTRRRLLLPIDVQRFKEQRERAKENGGRLKLNSKRRSGR